MGARAWDRGIFSLAAGPSAKALSSNGYDGAPKETSRCQPHVVRGRVRSELECVN